LFSWKNDAENFGDLIRPECAVDHLPEGGHYFPNARENLYSAIGSKEMIENCSDTSIVNAGVWAI
jgi:hypothetical protein